MKVMILAAGVGSRLAPFTDTMPKALVSVAGQPMIMHLLRRLVSLGYSDFFVNLHHHAAQLMNYLEQNKPPGTSISYSDESDCLLDTGGALMRARHLLDGDQPIVVHNVDVWTTLTPQNLMEGFATSAVSAVLAVRNRKTSRHLLFDSDNRLCGWRNNTTGENRIAVHGHGELTPLAFSGVQVIDPQIFKWFPKQPRFSLVDLYLDAAEAGAVIKAFPHDSDLWFDLGTAERIREFENAM